MKKPDSIILLMNDLKNGEEIRKNIPGLDKFLDKIPDTITDPEERAKAQLLKSSAMKNLLVGTFLRSFAEMVTGKPVEIIIKKDDAQP